MPTDEHDETSKIEESASALLSTIDAYKKIADSLPISEELRAFRGDIREATAALDSIEEDSTAIDVRLMLQRKYFSKGDSANIKRILRSAAALHAEKQAELNDLIECIEAINSSPITLSLSDGSSIQSNYEIAEKIIYGFYLHADIRKIRSLLSLAPQMKLLATAPYVIERENVLLNAYALLTTLGYTPFVPDNTDKAGMLSWSDDASEGQNISSSPYWSNYFGHDASDEEVFSIVKDNSPEDNLVLLLASAFFTLLKNEEYESDVLRQLVWEDFWDDWGDFGEAHASIASMPSPGISSKVIHEGGPNYAQVKVLPKVENPWVTSTPQLIQADMHLILLTRRNGEWKINGIAISSQCDR